MSYAAFTVDVPNMGSVSASFRDAKTIIAQASNALLHGGLLYSLNATIGLHGDLWYPLSGAVVTGQLGKNAPKKVEDPIIAAVADAVNRHLSLIPEIITRARQEIFDAKTKSLECGMEQSQKYADRYVKEVNDYKVTIAKHLAGKP